MRDGALAGKPGDRGQNDADTAKGNHRDRRHRFFVSRKGTAEVRQQQNGDEQRENKTGHARREQSGNYQESSAHDASNEGSLALSARVSYCPAGDCYYSKKVIKDLREHAVDLYHA
jgi:hypothetical protein